MLHVGGRGGAQMTMALSLNTVHWTVERETTNAGGGGGETCELCYHPLPGEPGGTTYFVPIPDWWEGIWPGYGPGVLQGRRGKQGVLFLTRLTFTSSDGTEYEFRDQLYAGEPKPNGTSRGTVFVTADGTAATFISDTAIGEIAGSQLAFPSGSMLLADGSSYRIDGGTVTWMRDRNGNRMSFTYDANHRVTTVTDSINRQVTVTYADMVSIFYDQIGYKGFGGAPRAILDGACLTALRTGAAGGLAARLMAPQNCEVVALYGAGVQARTQLEALLAERRPREIRVVARTRAHVAPFISASEVPAGVSLVAADRDAAVGAQIVICATTSADPVFATKDLGDDAHVTGVGSFRPEACEFPPEILEGARVVVDQREAAIAESGEVITALREGWLRESDLIEIGESKARRVAGDHITVFKSVGNGIQDLAVGCRVVERAEELGIGRSRRCTTGRSSSTRSVR